MDLQSIHFIIIALVIGCVTTWVIVWYRKKPKISHEDVLGFQNTIAELEKQASFLREENTRLQSDCNEKDKVAAEKIKSLREENARLQSDCNEKDKVAAEKIKETEKSLKSQYDNIIQQTKEENNRLDKALKLAIEGKLDESVKMQLIEAEKSAAKIHEMDKEHSRLIKEVKRLENEIEEAEEEQESLERKLKAKGRELQEVTEKLDRSGRENKHLHDELEQSQNELTNRLDELKRKNDSIEFVQEILSAPETGEENIQNLYRTIDIFESFLRGRFMDCNAYLYNTDSSLTFNINGQDISGRDGFVEKKKFFLQLFDEWASVKRKMWLDKKTTIAFVGEFSAGKTSIVNRVLSQDNPNVSLLPVSTKATTAIPTYIAGGIAETYNFVTPDDKLKAINEEIFKKVSKEVLDELSGVSSLIKYFVMTYKNPNLEGLSILDTPGFNSNDEEDKIRTIDVINECDALFWVFDVNAGTINRSSIALIKEKLNKPLIVVINKVDTKPTSEVDTVEQLIRKTLDDEGLKVERFVRFSAKAPLTDIMDPICSIHHDESRDAFIDIVEEDLKNLMDIFDTYVKNAEKELRKSEKKLDRITNTCIDELKDLYDSCSEAHEIPQWKEYTFRKDRFEMDASEGSRLLELLESIANTKCDNIAKIYEKMRKIVAEEQQQHSNLSDIKASWQKIEDCMKEFKKTTKKFRQL